MKSRKIQEFWTRTTENSQIITHFQHLVISQQIEREKQEKLQTPGQQSEDLEAVIRGDSSNKQFQNLIPVINSSIDDEDYLTPIFYYISDNLSDLSFFYKFIDYTKQIKRDENLDTSAADFDKNVFNIVMVISCSSRKSTIIDKLLLSRTSNNRKMIFQLVFQLQKEHISRKDIQRILGNFLPRIEKSLSLG